MTTLAAITAWEKTLLLTRFALEKKAYDLVVLEVRELTSAAQPNSFFGPKSASQSHSSVEGGGGNRS